MDNSNAVNILLELTERREGYPEWNANAIMEYFIQGTKVWPRWTLIGKWMVTPIQYYKW